jgi:arylsulfatase A-like enzyme
MYGPWDAPRELQQSLLSEGDPPPLALAAPPTLVLTPEDDPDAPFRYGCAYAAQVMAIDAAWGELCDALGETGQVDEWLVMLIGVRGFPLGEHGRIGGVDERLYAEQLHVPWLVRFPGGQARLTRLDQLTTHADLSPTLYDWLAKAAATWPDGESLLPLVGQLLPAWREALLAVSPAAMSLRRRDWSLRQEPAATAAGQAAELFVRPDDRWEANDVAKLCPDVVESLSGDSAQALRQLSANEPRSTRLCRK